MTFSTVVITTIKNSYQAGEDLGNQINKELSGKNPDVVIVFASSQHQYSKLLTAIKKTCQPSILLGCSSAGEFINDTHAEGAVSAIAIRSAEMQFSLGLGNNLQGDIVSAAEQVTRSFKGLKNLNYQYKSALVLADALAGYTDRLISELSKLTSGTYQFFGGGAGDDAKFNKTHVFYDNKAYTNAVVVLEILSNKSLGIGVRHGWKTASGPIRVTESEGMKLKSLNSIVALEVFKQHAKATGQDFDQSDPIPFFLHNVLGIKTVDGYILRVPLAINKDGSINCASNIPNGAIVHFMKTTAKSAAHAAKDATEDALKQLQGEKGGVALFFDCVATRLRTGNEFITELKTLQNKLGKIKFAGCNTYGQIARADNQFSGFHNCTAVVCIIPE